MTTRESNADPVCETLEWAIGRLTEIRGEIAGVVARRPVDQGAVQALVEATDQVRATVNVYFAAAGMPHRIAADGSLTT